MQLSEKRKTFSEFFFFHFWNLHQILNILKKKKMFAIAIVFPKLQTVKNFVRPLCKKCHLGTRLDSQHVKVSQTLEKSPWKHLFDVFLTFWEKLIWKMFPLLLFEILLVFLNTLTAEVKYPIEDWGNFPLPIQMQLSEIQNKFSWFFLPFLESTSNFQHFETKDDGHT